MMPLDSKLLVIFADKHVLRKFIMLRWRNWSLKYERVQDRALKLYPGVHIPTV